jgi:hypothetical protein
MNVLVVTSCTGEKLHKHNNALQFTDFQDNSLLQTRTQQLAEYSTPAYQMYTGEQHLALMKGIQFFRDGGREIDVVIFSAAYGILSEQDPVVPYNVTFNKMNNLQVADWAERQHFTEKFIDNVQSYDLVFIILGDKYLQALDWQKVNQFNQQRTTPITFMFFAGEMSKSKILKFDNFHMLLVRKQEARKFRVGLIGLKGFLLSSLLSGIVNQQTSIPQTWHNIKANPSFSRELIMDAFESSRQPTLFELPEDDILPYYAESFPVPDWLISKNYQTETMFFMPENDDRVDPNYDFINDVSVKNRNPLVHDVYAHDIFKKPNYHGVLLSMVNISNATLQKKTLIDQIGLRAFLHLPEHFPLMGDCGAFSYLTSDQPLYTTDEVIDYYENYRFNYGVSVDHLIVGPYQRDVMIRNYRYELTLQLAEEFLNKCGDRQVSFAPVGVVQGWDPASFRKAAQHLISLGYRRLAIGGIARETSPMIYEIMKQISPIIPDESFRVHLLGVARDMKTMKSFQKLGMTSFDSASPLRRAWLGTGHNYHMPNGQRYTAIRIPEASETSGRIKKMLASGGHSFEKYKSLEKQALQAMRDYDLGHITIDGALQTILAYDELLGEKRENHESLYRKLLENKPWKDCSCEICRNIGIDVVIFRGNNRNRRRGFHNTHVFFEEMKKN